MNREFTGKYFQTKHVIDVAQVWSNQQKDQEGVWQQPGNLQIYLKKTIFFLKF